LSLIAQMPLEAGLQPLDYAAVAGYLALTFGIALWFGRRQQSTEDYFVGGRRMPWLAVGLSILATLFSTISYLGLPGEAIKHGIGVFSGYMALPLAAIVITRLWVPFFMRLRLTSAYEYLEQRFSPPVRVVGGGLFILLRCGWMSMVIYVASVALDRVKGPDWEWLPGNDLYWWIGIIGLVAAVYTAVGGIQAVIWVDVLQCFLLLAGVLMAIGYVVYVDGTGPRDWWSSASTITSGHTAPPVFSLDLTLRVTIITAMINNFFWNICTHGSDQVVLQRYFTTGSVRAARRSYFINLGVDLTMCGLMTVAGFALLAFYLGHPERLPDGETARDMADKLFPHFLGHELPAGCAGLIISAFLCDAIQTLESGANAIAAVVSEDIAPKRRTEKNTLEKRALNFARFSTVVITAVVTGVAYAIALLQQTYNLTIIDMMPKFFNMFVGPLAAMFCAGMFLPRCTTRTLMPAVLVGLCVSILWSWWDVIVEPGTKPTILLAIAVPYLTTLLVASVLSLIAGTDGAGKLTWRAVVSRSESEGPSTSA
jgi:SSS family solute:Na+ symporter